MRLYLLPSSFSENMTSLEIRGKDYNYLINVLRLKKGQRLMGRDRNGGLWNLEITEVGKGCCVLSAEKADAIRAVTDNVPERAPLKPIVLYQCLPKGRKADDIIKKATEAGVRDIVLVKSRNCVATSVSLPMLPNGIMMNRLPRNLDSMQNTKTSSIQIQSTWILRMSVMCSIMSYKS